LLALFVALVSPLHALGEALFSAHMAQHLLLAAVAAPLLVLGAPLLPLLWALPLPYRRRFHNARWLFLARIAHATRRRLLPIWLLHVAALWVWHARALYELALRSEVAHAAEHMTLLGTALLFWWAAIPANLRERARGGASVPALFALAVQDGALGGLLLASRTPWYPAHAPWTAAWGLTPLADQQLAGLLMMLPGDAIYLGAALTLAAAWLRPADSRARSDTRQARLPTAQAGPAPKGVE
jgi:cytochrome c oxidase assembly factor CtaG